jgi:hypothetical protein
MCETELMANSERPVNRGLCSLLTAYAYACGHQGIDVHLPKECVVCTINFQQVTEDNHFNLERVPNLADIVLVTEEKKCMKVEGLADKLQSLAQDIVSKLQAENPGVDVRFGMVGFNGPNVHRNPHLHTGEGLTSFDASIVKKAAQKMEFRESPKSGGGDGNVSPMTAIYYAAEHYPFRTGAKKVVVVMKCSSCHDSTEDYYDVQNKVLERGITLHLIQEEDIEVSGQSEDYIGIDARSVYTSADTGKIESPRKELRKKVLRPHDQCSILAQESNGTVFHLTPSMASLSPVLSQRMAETSKPHSCTVCECQSQGRQPKTVCFPCGLSRPASLETSDSFFNIHYIKPLKNLQERAVQQIKDSVFFK